MTTLTSFTAVIREAESRQQGSTIPTMPPMLLAIYEVEWEHRIRCQAPGCVRSVHKRVHVVREAGRLMVIGSTCSSRLFGFGTGRDSPRYGSVAGQRLTDEERQLLISNTEELMARLEEKFLIDNDGRRTEATAQLARKEGGRSLQRAAPEGLPPESDGERPWTVEDGERAARSWAIERRLESSQEDFTPAQLQAAVNEVQASMRAKGVRAELIERRSYVEAQALVLLKKRRNY
jgi:hypothetical protein